MKHRWNHDATKTIAACEAPDGNDRTERTCKACGLIKISVHGANGEFWHRWRKDGHEWRGDVTPPCTISAAPSVASETTAKVIAV